MADMKDNISVSLEKDTIKWVDEQVTTGGKYRSRSHVIEVAINEKKTKVTLEAIQKLIDEFPIEAFDPTTDDQDEALQKWFNKLKAPFKEAP